MSLTEEQNISGHAFNALTSALTEDQWMPLSERVRIADAIVAAVVPVVRDYEQRRFLEAASTFPSPFREMIADLTRVSPATPDSSEEAH